MDKNSSIYIAGHRGVVGAALVRKFQREGFKNLILRTRQEIDLTIREGVFQLFAETGPQYVVIAAAKVGGISANMTSPMEFLLDNLKIQNNIMEACLHFQVMKTLFLGSSCIYPRECSQPMSEDDFMRGPLEPTNESYAIAKIAGIRLAHALYEQYGVNILCPMPCNVYGPGDHFEFERSHVVSAMVRRFMEAKSNHVKKVTLWGTGKIRREFMHVDDLADACLFLLRHFDGPDLVNVGTGIDYSIEELASMVETVVEYKGALEWDTTKPDGMPRKLLDVSRFKAMGWKHKIGLEEGLKTVLEDYGQRFGLVTNGESL